jgi:hypothetical protein
MIASTPLARLKVQHLGDGRFAVESTAVKPMGGSLLIDEGTMRLLRRLDTPKEIGEAARSVRLTIGDPAIDRLIAYGLLVPADDLPVVAEARRRCGIKTIVIQAWGGLGDVLLTTPVYEASARAGFRTYVEIAGAQAPLKRDLLRNSPHLQGLFDAGREKPEFDAASGALVISPDYAALRLSLSETRHHASIAVGMLTGFDTRHLRPSIFFDGEERQRAAQLRQQYGRFGVIQRASSAMCGIKDLPDHCCARLTADIHEVTWLQVGAPREPRIARTVDLRGQFRPALIAISAASVFVGPDSVYAHAATASRTPAVVAFGPTSPDIWGHSSAFAQSQQKPCAPCIELPGTRSYCLSNYCMRDLSASELCDRVLEILRGTGPAGGLDASPTMAAAIASPHLIAHTIRGPRAAGYRLAQLQDALLRFAFDAPL